MDTKYIVGAKMIESAETLGLDYCSDDIFIWYGGTHIYRFNKNMKPQDCRQLDVYEMIEEEIKSAMFRWGEHLDVFINDPTEEWSDWRD